MSFFNPELNSAFYPWESIQKPKEVKMEELKVTKERVLKASEKCETAREILKELFPDVFQKQEVWHEVVENGSLSSGFFLKKEYGTVHFCYRSLRGQESELLHIDERGAICRTAGVTSDAGFNLDRVGQITHY